MDPAQVHQADGCEMHSAGQRTAVEFCQAVLQFQRLFACRVTNGTGGASAMECRSHKGGADFSHQQPNPPLYTPHD